MGNLFVVYLEKVRRFFAGEWPEIAERRGRLIESQRLSLERQDERLKLQQQSIDALIAMLHSTEAARDLYKVEMEEGQSPSTSPWCYVEPASSASSSSSYSTMSGQTTHFLMQVHPTTWTAKTEVYDLDGTYRTPSVRCGASLSVRRQ